MRLFRRKLMLGKEVLPFMNVLYLCFSPGGSTFSTLVNSKTATLEPVSPHLKPDSAKLQFINSRFPDPKP